MCVCVCVCVCVCLCVCVCARARCALCGCVGPGGGGVCAWLYVRVVCVQRFSPPVVPSYQMGRLGFRLPQDVIFNMRTCASSHAILRIRFYRRVGMSALVVGSATVTTKWATVLGREAVSRLWTLDTLGLWSEGQEFPLINAGRLDRCARICLKLPSPWWQRSEGRLATVCSVKKEGTEVNFVFD